MGTDRTNRFSDTLILGGALLLIVPSLLVVPGWIGRGRAVPAFVLTGLFPMLVLPALALRARSRRAVHGGRVRDRFSITVVALLLGSAALTLGLAASPIEVGRLLLTRYLMAFEAAALLWVLALSMRREDPGAAPPARLPAHARLAVMIYLLAAVLLALGGRAAGTGPVGPALALFVVAVGAVLLAVELRLATRRRD